MRTVAMRSMLSRLRSRNCSMRSPSTKFLQSSSVCSLWKARHSAWLNPPTPLMTRLRHSCTSAFFRLET